jgi:hypothetical protein
MSIATATSVAVASVEATWKGVAAGSEFGPKAVLRPEPVFVEVWV